MLIVNFLSVQFVDAGGKCSPQYKFISIIQDGCQAWEHLQVLKWCPDHNATLNEYDPKVNVIPGKSYIRIKLPKGIIWIYIKHVRSWETSKYFMGHVPYSYLLWERQLKISPVVPVCNGEWLSACTEQSLWCAHIWCDAEGFPPGKEMEKLNMSRSQSSTKISHIKAKVETLPVCHSFDCF